MGKVCGVRGGNTGAASPQGGTPSLPALRGGLAGAACTDPAVRAAEDSAKREVVELSQQLWGGMSWRKKLEVLVEENQQCCWS